MLQDILFDVLLTSGVIGFLLSDMKQFWKLRKSDFPTKAISRTHLKIKLYSLVAVSVVYFGTGFFISGLVSVAQFFLTCGITYYVYRRYNE